MPRKHQSGFEMCSQCQKTVKIFQRGLCKEVMMLESQMLLTMHTHSEETHYMAQQKWSNSCFCLLPAHNILAQASVLIFQLFLSFSPIWQNILVASQAANHLDWVIPFHPNQEGWYYRHCWKPKGFLFVYKHHCKNMNVTHHTGFKHGSLSTAAMLETENQNLGRGLSSAEVE